MKRLAALLPAACLLLASCGYSATRLLPAEYQTLYIEPFQNRIPITEESSERVGLYTNYPELEARVTRGVINRFLFDGNLRVTNQSEKADIILSGTLLDFYRQPIRRQDDATIEEYRLNLSSTVTLRDRKGKFLFENRSLVGDATYFLTGSSAKSETAAVDDLITDFGRRVVELVIEYW